MQLSFSPIIRTHSLRIIFLALLVTVLGHFLLLFGLPFISFGSSPEIAEDLIIRTEIKAEPPQKIQMARSPKKKVSEESVSNSSLDSNTLSGEQGGNIDQKGVAFKLPLPGILYYDAYVDGQKYQTA